MPKKSSKLWKKALDVFSSAIPFENAVNCRRMAQIVQARLHPWTTWTVDAGTRTKTSKALFRASACQRSATFEWEARTRRIIAVVSGAATEILKQRRLEVCTYRDAPALRMRK